MSHFGQIKFWSIFLAILSLQVMLVESGVHCGANLTDFVQNRQKRSLIFANSGTLKFSIGPSLPVDLGDPIVWRSLVTSYNLHGGHYALPTVPLYPWDKWENTFARSMRNHESDINLFEQYKNADESRLFLYIALETYMDKQHGNGRACLLRAICQNAQVEQHVGVLTEILNIVLMPGKAEALDAGYREAYELGKSGVNCLKLYANCPVGASILDQLTQEF